MARQAARCDLLVWWSAAAWRGGRFETYTSIARGSRAGLPHAWRSAGGADPIAPSIVHKTRRRLSGVDLTALTGPHSCPSLLNSIPIWLGGSAGEGVEPGAQLEDGFIFFGGGVDSTIDFLDTATRTRCRLGRSVEDFAGDYVALSGGDMSQLTAERSRLGAMQAELTCRWSQWALGLTPSMLMSATSRRSRIDSVCGSEPGPNSVSRPPDQMADSW